MPSRSSGVIANLDSTQARAARPIVVAYVNPVQLDVLLGAGFQLIHRDPDAVVVQRAGPGT